VAWRVRRPPPRGAPGWPAVCLGSPASWRASACAWPCRCLRRPAVGCLRRGTFGPRASSVPSTRCSPVARLAANDLERRPCALVAACRCPRAPGAPPLPPLPEGVGFVGGGCSPEGEQSATGAASEEVAGCSDLTRSVSWRAWVRGWTAGPEGLAASPGTEVSGFGNRGSRLHLRCLPPASRWGAPRGTLWSGRGFRYHRGGAFRSCLARACSCPPRWARAVLRRG